MPEDSGKKSHVRDFLIRVSRGLGFIEEIWIDRVVKKPGSDGNFNDANSLSGREISNITSLLRDDIKCVFEDNSFTFRFIAASPGSGKTAVIEYFQELIKTDVNYGKYSIVVDFSLNEMLSIIGERKFGVGFYLHVLTQTFWKLIGDDGAQISSELVNTASNFLRKVFGESELAQIKLSSNFSLKFTNTFTNYLSKYSGNLRDFFFSMIVDFGQNCPQASFIYLIDELDALQSHSDYTSDARSIIRDLFNKSASLRKIRLMVYMVGRADHVNSFVNKQQDSALYSRVHSSIVNLVKFRIDECEQIRRKLKEIFSGAYAGFKNYEQARKEIENITLIPGNDYDTLREFCQKIAYAFIVIHDKYFLEESFNQFERNARSRLKSESIKMWKDCLGENCTETEPFKEEYRGHNRWEEVRGKNGYKIIASQTTTVIENHAVDCYAELWHNDHPVAIAYGEAKNYSLIKEHIDTFYSWLRDFEYYGQDTKNPSNLAFFIAPTCTELQRRKMEIRKIRFIEEKKVDEVDKIPVKNNSPVDINTANQSALEKALKGTRIRKTTIQKIIADRRKSKYNDLDDLENRIKLTKDARHKIQKKIEDKLICIQ